LWNTFTSMFTRVTTMLWQWCSWSWGSAGCSASGGYRWGRWEQCACRLGWSLKLPRWAVCQCQRSLPSAFCLWLARHAP
jgi:hypothetical protein